MSIKKTNAIFDAKFEIRWKSAKKVYTKKAVPIPARLFFLTALAISVAPRLFKFPEMSVPLSTRTFVFSIHSLGYKYGVPSRNFVEKMICLKKVPKLPDLTVHD
jgi:hypothetical protein